ncbi:hypothetical protein BS78_03G146200 [Paspalum vaginatum]|nr:hypothetical protein BS78_03G146200 [Paspalum vaginatum]
MMHIPRTKNHRRTNPSRRNPKRSCTRNQRASSRDQTTLRRKLLTLVKKMARTKQTARKATSARGLRVQEGRAAPLPPVTHTPPQLENGMVHTRCREENGLAQILCRALREMRRRPCPFFSVQTVQAEGHCMASVVLPSSHTAVRQTITVYGANEEDAYDKVTLAAITSLSSSGAAGMSVLRYLPTDGYDDEWLRRHNMLEERIDTRPYAATMQFAHSVHGMYLRAEDRVSHYRDQHMYAQDRIEELEAELAEAQQRLAQYEQDPSVAPVVEDEDSMVSDARNGR